MKTLAERISESRKEAGLTQGQLAKAAGIKNQSTIGMLESGDRKKTTFIAEIASALGVNAQWLSHGVGPRKSGEKNEATLINLSEHPDLCPVKRVNFKLAAGVHGYAVELDNGDKAPVFFRKDWMQSNNYKPERLVAFRVSGASMQPSLWDGDLVVINLDDTQPRDGDVFAVNYEGEPGIKRLRRDAGEWWLASDNADQRKFAPKRCTEDVDILGRVIYKQSDRI